MHPAIKDYVSKPAVDLYCYLRYDRWRLPFRQYKPFVDKKDGVEVGGPSAVFSTVLPVYPHIRSLDGVNFATDTIWEGRIQAGEKYNFYREKAGRQFIADATDLSQIDSDQYDFLLSSNCLEHGANPIKALVEWKRVIRPGGGLVLVLPNQASNFDHRRPVTELDHMLDDFTKDVGEDDLTHLDEILANHDLSMDPPAGTPAQFKERSLKNLHNRTLHHHVFDVRLVEDLLRHLDLEILDISTTRTDFFALAKK
jgi:SAM-dependent methyltransferase